MVCERGSMLVVSAPGALEPLRKSGVGQGAPAGGQRPVGDLTCQRVFEDVFALPFERRLWTVADEVPLLEQLQVGFGRLGERAHGAFPKGATNDRGELQGSLLR